ncbi:MAG: hypothetical protein J6Y65_03790 [Eggerthellaceae bacterium]|nr:hypothetical protein [Eggerthellaceae bacterium]
MGIKRFLGIPLGVVFALAFALCVNVGVAYPAVVADDPVSSDDSIIVADDAAIDLPGKTPTQSGESQPNASGTPHLDTVYILIAVFAVIVLAAVIIFYVCSKNSKGKK